MLNYDRLSLLLETCGHGNKNMRQLIYLLLDWRVLCLFFKSSVYKFHWLHTWASSEFLAIKQSVPCQLPPIFISSTFYSWGAYYTTVRVLTRGKNVDFRVLHYLITE